MKRILCIILCPVLWPAGGSAATVAEAVDLAWARHPEARALQSRRYEADAEREIANGLIPAPGEVSVGARDDRSGRDLGKREIEAELAVPVWLPGQRSANRAAADGARDVIEASEAMLRLRLAGEVRETWGALQLARTGLQLARQRLETSEALQDNVDRRFRAGDLAKVDANLARQEHLAAEAAVTEAENAVRAAEQAWRLLVGSAAPASLDDEADDGIDIPIENHPSVRAAAAELTAARGRLRVAEQSGREAPEVAVTVMREREEYGIEQNTMVGVALRLPFASGARRRQASAGAQAELAHADAALALARDKVEFERQRATAEVDVAQRNLRFAWESRELSAENLRLAQKAFDLGELDLPRLLQARIRAFEAELSFNQQTHAVALAIGRLRQAKGVTP